MSFISQPDTSSGSGIPNINKNGWEGHRWEKYIWSLGKAIRIRIFQGGFEEVFKLMGILRQIFVS